MVKIQETSKLAKLSVAALMIGTSITTAQEVQAPAVEHAPVAAPAPVVEAAPVVVPVVAPVIAQAVAEPAPVAKPVETASTTVAGTKISLYGRLELNSAYEDGITSGLWSGWAASNANHGVGKAGDPQGRTSFSAARTRIGLNLEGPSKDDEPSLKGKFEADFAGNSNFNNFNGGGTDATVSINTSDPTKSSVSVSSAFRLRQAWGSVNYKDLGLTILFGQTDDVVMPLDPPAVNPSSLNGAGNIGNRRPQIRVTEAIGPVEIAVAATHDRLRADDKVASSSPALQIRGGLKLPATWAGEKANMALGVGYLYAKDEAANLDDENRTKRGPNTNLIGADLSLPIMDILTLTGEWFMGQNLTRYGDGSIGLNHTSSSNPKKVKEDGLKSMGWWGALGAKLPASFSAAAGLGMEALDGDVDTKNVNNSEIIPGSRKDNMFIFGNVAYNFTSAAKVTFEYLNLATSYADKADGSKVGDGHLNRYEVNFRYDFK